MGSDKGGTSISNLALLLVAASLGAGAMWFWDDSVAKQNQRIVEKQLASNFTTPKVDVHKLGLHGPFVDIPIDAALHAHDESDHEHTDGDEHEHEHEHAAPVLSETQKKAMREADERALEVFGRPGGGYTLDDIAKNGIVPPYERFHRVVFKYDLRAFPGEPIDPLTGTKTHAAFDWWVNGALYHFSCVPTLEEFVMRAKKDAKSIPNPEQFVEPPRPKSEP